MLVAIVLLASTKPQLVPGLHVATNGGNSTVTGICLLCWNVAEVRLRGRDFVRLCRGYVGGRGRRVLVR